MIKNRKLIITAACVCAAACLIITMVSSLLFAFALDRSSPIQLGNLSGAVEVANSTADKVGEPEEYKGFRGTRSDRRWYFGGEDVYTYSEDGLKLHGRLFLKSADGTSKDVNTYVVACHGYNGSAVDMAGIGRSFYDLGYNVLTPDARAHGESEGSIAGMGWLERRDICKWIDEIISRDKRAEIILYGISMGGATVMMAAGEKLPSNVKAVIEDCGYTSVWDEFSHKTYGTFGLPEYPFLYLASLMTEAAADYGFKEASALEQVKKCNVPILFIHGERDKIVPFEMMEVLYEAASCEKEKLAVPGAGHAMSCTTDASLYWSTIEVFLKKYI